MEELAEALSRLFGTGSWQIMPSQTGGVYLSLNKRVAEDLARILACLDRAVPEVNVPRETEG